MRTFILLLSIVAVAADWPRFRGVNGAGVGESAPTKWTKSDNRLWTVDLPGQGNGSPIVAKGKIFLQCAAADGSKRSLVCLDAVTGKELWAKHQTGGPAEKLHKKNSLASSTPATDGERVYCCFWDGKGVALVAYDFAGKELWKEELGAFKSDHGAGMSPMVHAGKVFVNFDQEGSSAILAHDAVTGKKAWSQERKSFRACYSTPLVRELPAGKSEIIVLSTAGVAAYDPADGHINWDSPFTWDGMALRSVASPVLAGELVIALTGDGGGSRYCCGIALGAAPKRVWETKSTKLTPYVPCPVVKDKHLFWLTDQGILQCINPLTGKAVWTEQIFSAAVSASPILVGDVLMMIDERGKTIAGKVDATGFEKLSESEVGGQVIATPAVADGRLYIRGGTMLLCVAGK